MPLAVANQTELIPGYRLLQRLGQGGFGEVWKAEAPGGILKAVKIVYGDVHATVGDRLTARQELKALDRVKSVRHPFILSLERYDIIDGQLVIVMELADRDLSDRFKECRAQGLPGIPRDELLRHVEETAEALELTTPLGRMAAECRAAARKDLALAGDADGPTVATFGSFWFAVPRRLLLQRVAQCLCYRVVQGWRAEASENLEGQLQNWIGEQVAGWKLTPELLLLELQRVASAAQGGTAEAIVGEGLAPYAPNQPGDLRRHPKLAAEAMDALETLVGAPEDNLAAAAGSACGKALAQAVAVLSGELEERLAEVALGVLAEPHFRLLGVEERVLARMLDLLGQQAAAHQAEAEKLLHEAAGVSPKLGPVLETLQRGSLWGWGKKNQAAADLLELLCWHGTLRVRMLECQALSALFQNLQSSFHRHQRKVGCCRRRIAEFLKSFEAAAARQQTPVDLGLGQYLLPAGCGTLPEAVEKILASLTTQELAETKRRVVALIGRKFKAHVHVCTAPADFFKQLEEDVVKEVTAFAEAALGRAHAAEMYVEQHGQDKSVLHDLAGAFDEAYPELAGSRLDPEGELCVVAVPPGSEGDYFRGLVRRALPDRSLVSAASTDDIVFYREVPRLPLATLPQLGPAAEQVYRQFLESDQLPPHSRMDILDWTPPAGPA